MRGISMAAWVICALLGSGVACGESDTSGDSDSGGSAGVPSTGGGPAGGSGGSLTGGAGGTSSGGAAGSLSGSGGVGGSLTGGAAGTSPGGAAGSLSGSGGTAGSLTGGAAGTGPGGSAGAPSTGGSGAVVVDPSWQECDGPGQCLAMGMDCCGFGCSEEPLSRFVGIHSAHRQDLLEELCGPNPDPCPACGVMFYNEQYVGVCREGRCQAVDVFEDELSACDTAADCRLRWGGRCCELCSEDWSYPPEALLAVSTTAGFAAQICAPEADCAPCENQTYLENATVDCVAGHCQLVLP